MQNKVIIADDHQMFREGLKSLLQEEDELVVIGEAADGKEAVEMVERLGPHIVIMDVSLPEMNGVDATKQIMELPHPPKVIGLSAHKNEMFVHEMLKAGAAGYLLKHTAYEELFTAIEHVLSEKKYISPDVASTVVDTHVVQEDADNSAFAVLTDREREILQQVAEGKTTKEIAADVSVSVKTVETHRRNIMQKLGLRSIAELTKYAIREGLSPLD